MSAQKMADDIGRMSRETLRKYTKELLLLRLITVKKKLCKNRTWFEPSQELVDWYKKGGDEKLFISLSGLFISPEPMTQNLATEPQKVTQNLATDDAEFGNSLNVGFQHSSFSQHSLKNDREASLPRNVHKEQKEKKEKPSFEQIALNMLSEGVEPFLVEKVCDAVKASKTPIGSPESYMRRVLANIQKQSEVKFAKIIEKYSLFIPEWQKQAEKLLASVADRFTWSWWEEKVKVTHKGHGEYRWFTISNPNSIYQIRNWTGAY